MVFCGFKEITAIRIVSEHLAVELPESLRCGLVKLEKLESL